MLWKCLPSFSQKDRRMEQQHTETTLLFSDERADRERTEQVVKARIVLIFEGRGVNSIAVKKKQKRLQLHDCVNHS